MTPAKVKLYANGMLIGEYSLWDLIDLAYYSCAFPSGFNRSINADRVEVQLEIDDYKYIETRPEPDEDDDQ